MDECQNFYKINFQIMRLIDDGIVNPSIGEAKPAVAVKIESISNHARKRGISVEEAQFFVDTAKIMFGQGNRNMYLSRDGSSTVLIENSRLISVYRKTDFDKAIIAILEVLNNAL